MLIRLNCDNNKIVMNIQLGCVDYIAKQVLEDISLPFGSFTFDIDDEDITINLTLSAGGDEI